MIKLSQKALLIGGAIAVLLVLGFFYISSDSTPTVVPPPSQPTPSQPPTPTPPTPSIPTNPPNGRLFFGRVFRKPPPRECTTETGLLCYYTDELGVAEIPHALWEKTVQCEQSVWDGNIGASDRGDEHARAMKNYESLPASLGDVIEVGSGPFGVIDTILQSRPDVTLNSITLLDPSISWYQDHVPKCTFKGGSFRGYRTFLIQSGAEVPFFTERYDTLIMLNVVEHCRSAFEIFENIYRMLKPGGLLIIHENSYDEFYTGDNGSKYVYHELCHPLKLKQAMLDLFLSHFEPVYRNDTPTPEAVARRKAGEVNSSFGQTYFIGRKKSPVAYTPKLQKLVTN